jgi:hypothetical protein
MKVKGIFIIILILSVFLFISTVSADGSKTLNDTSYYDYFHNASGDIKEGTVDSGDTLDIKGTLYNKNIIVSKPLNIISSDK